LSQLSVETDDGCGLLIAAAAILVDLILDRRLLFGPCIVIQIGEIALGVGGSGFAAALRQYVQAGTQVVAVRLLLRFGTRIRFVLGGGIRGGLVLIRLGLLDLLG